MKSRNLRLSTLAVGAVALLVAGVGSSASARSYASAGPTAGASSHAVLTTANSAYGKVIFDGSHRALYVFSADRGSTSNCYGACAKAWPPLLTSGRATASAGLSRGLIGSTRRRDGSTQVTYAGHPLYYFSGDKGSQINCQAADSNGGYWYVVSSNGRPNKGKGHHMMMHH